MKIIGFIFLIIIIVFGVTFSVLNATPTLINYYFDSKTLPLSLLLAISFIVGLLLAFVVMSISHIRLKANLRCVKKQLKVSEKEIDNLRSMPVKD